MSGTDDGFKPRPLSGGGHRQTLLGYLCRRALRWDLPTEDVVVDAGDDVRLLLRATWQAGPREEHPALLLIHGLTDDNVYAQHTLQLADALFMAGKPYEFMPMLGTHLAGSSDPVVKLRQQMRVMEFFNRELKP